MWKCYILIANFSLCRFLAQCHWKTIEVNWTKFSLNQYMLCIHSSKQLFLTKFSIGTSWEIIKNGNIFMSEPFNVHSLILHIKTFIFNGQFLRVGIDRIYFFVTERCILLHSLEYFLQKCPKSSQTNLAPETNFSALLLDLRKNLDFWHFSWFLT